MYLLDVDTLERIFRGDTRVARQLNQTPKSDVWISSITVEEMLNGTLSEINKAREQSSRRDIELPSRYLVRLIERLRVFNLLPYINAAEELYRSYEAAVKRIGKMDCRLAAHASVSGLIVVTCNTADFSRIPGTEVEDWSKDENLTGEKAGGT